LIGINIPQHQNAMKKLLSFILCILSAVSVKAQTASASSADSKATVMKFDTDTIDFGKVIEGEKVTREFVFTNTGTQPLVIKKVIATCACSEIVFPKTPVAPGQTGTITITYNTEGKYGYQNKSFFVQSNNRDGEIVLHLNGIVDYDLKRTSCPTVVVSDTMPKTAAKPAPAPAKPASAPTPARPAPVIVPVYKSSPPVMPPPSSAPRF
jgi:hypothetical protein